MLPPSSEEGSFATFSESGQTPHTSPAANTSREDYSNYKSHSIFGTKGTKYLSISTEGAFKLYWPNLFDECLVSLSTGKLSPAVSPTFHAAFVVTPL